MCELIDATTAGFVLWCTLGIGTFIGYAVCALVKACSDGDPSTDAWEREAGLEHPMQFGHAASHLTDEERAQLLAEIDRLGQS